LLIAAAWEIPIPNWNCATANKAVKMYRHFIMRPLAGHFHTALNSPASTMLLTTDGDPALRQ
jgi:hypothetical protein